MNGEERVRIALQKKGRLTEKSLTILRKCGIEFELRKDRLVCQCENFPLDIMFVRDDDCPEYVKDGVCELGIVGYNVLEEKLLESGVQPSQGVETIKTLGFGQCRLSIAVPKGFKYDSIKDLEGLKIATSYPMSLKKYLNQNGVKADSVFISGSVEIAPSINVADVVCDLVSTGATLRSNGLIEVDTIYESESLLIKTKKELSPKKKLIIDRLLSRVESVLKALSSKYIMMNAPVRSLEQIKEILPGMEDPSIIPLTHDKSKVAIHAVSTEDIFWETMEGLKAVGASSILVVPIEKIVE